MSAPARAPIIVGTGQVSAKGDPDASPPGLMAEAARRALEDSGAAATLAGHIDTVAAPQIFTWPVADPAAIVAGELGLEPRGTVRSAIGGTAPLMLLADACARISAGEREAVLVTGGEAVNPFMRAMREGRAPEWPGEDDGGAPERILPGDPAEPSHPAELAANLLAPLSYYPLFEHALRGASGRGVAEHRRLLGRLWERVGAPARQNPHAWTPEVPTAEQIATPSEGNRMAMHPYPKLLTANIQVDQGAAFVVCSEKLANEIGIEPERRIWVEAVAHGRDRWHVGSRERLDRSPAIAANGRAAMRHAGTEVGQIEHLDLYSCFPSAVEIAAAELGIDLAPDGPPPSVTGGLTFAGGPANNYCSHAVAAMSARLRSAPGRALLTGVGWYMTKHALALLGSEPPAQPYATLDVAAEIEHGAEREIASSPAAGATVESYTLAYGRDGEPALATVSALGPDGSRAFAKSDEPSTVAALHADDPLGAAIRVGEGGFRL